MTEAAISTGSAVEVGTAPGRAAHLDPIEYARVAVIIVTWNRRAAVNAVLAAVVRQDYPADHLDVAVIDNGSSDGTAAFLTERWKPERVIDNTTERAEQPAFGEGPAQASSGNAAGFASLTIVRNTHNLGGCGGFNTGFAWVESLPSPPHYVWLVDDDVDLPADALPRLVRTAASDPSIGLVGSRTVDFDDRHTTIETTIYFNPDTGAMAPHPPPGHRMHDSHRRWIEQVGDVRGPREFSGVREVDVLSACSLLARWSAVRTVGYWDRRYFIYCDDADWCLRFARAGHRVVLDLDAVVYHTYWLAKLTPARAYYAERNLAWLNEKILDPAPLRRSAAKRTGSLLLQSRKAATHCRLFHAEILRRTVADIARGRGGRLDDEGPAPIPLMEAFERAGAMRPDAEILVMCSTRDSPRWADELRSTVTHALLEAGRPADQPRWTYVVGPAADDPAALLPMQPERIRFENTRGSKLRAQTRYLRRRPAAVVVFDQANDFPLMCSTWNIHVDRRRPDRVQLERDGLWVRARFFARWVITAARGAWYAATVRPCPHRGVYG
jgi:GT2 family glycosyltransferase